MKVIKKFNDIKGESKLYEKRPIRVRAKRLNEDISIQTREGTLVGKKGEYLIEGIQGEIYPCGDIIFINTYKEVKE